VKLLSDYLNICDHNPHSYRQREQRDGWIDDILMAIRRGLRASRGKN